MQKIEIVEASDKSVAVAGLVKELLIELEPSSKDKVEETNLEQLTRTLLDSSKVWAFLAKHNDDFIGVITIHQCAAIYAGGIFGEISELYVKPEYRSFNIGEKLVNTVIKEGNVRGWKRLEVGSPPSDESPRSFNFYKRIGFEYTGSRLRRVIKR
jgi:ribosomal protein S18 acetylase RimI-like enzyme